ncbi:hypothetical protein [Sphingobacterium anhuiense]|uniref:YD repeat-containing protein n=1 Tax=Sphingobacterium anhuiense TaxID=493780 RepID=A0ABW5YVF8_9SPHI
MKSICILLLTSLCCLTAKAQLEIDIPIRSSLSSNSLDQAMRSEQNMEMYTGSPQISIPIHNLIYKDLNIPIDLSYNSIGFKVSQDASWLGLGWNMSFGSIIRSKIGATDNASGLDSISYRDRLSVNTLNIESITPLKNLLSVEEFEIYLQSMNSKIFNDYSYYYQRYTNGAQDYDFFLNAYNNGQGQPDIYYVNVPGDSFKFFLEPRTLKPVILDIKNNYKVEKYESYSWSITNGDGYKYIFNIQETASESSETTSWLLSKIISPVGNAIDFKYQNYGIENSIPEYVGYHLFKEGFVNYMHDLITDKGVRSYYLTSISSPLESINFILSTRADIFGTGPRKLDRIDVVRNSDNKVIKSAKLDYSYFESSMVGGSYAHGFSGYQTSVIKTPTNVEEFYSKRLKLNSLSIKGDANSVYENLHKFQYYDDIKFPLKTSAAVDHWGYFNGENNVDYIPNILYLDRITTDRKYMIVPNAVGNIDLRNYSRNLGQFPEQFLNFKGGNRGASSSHAKVGMLKTIQYPTGGTLEFDWGLNSFKNYRIPSIEQTKKFDSDLLQFLAQNGDGAFVNDNNEASSQSMKRAQFSIEGGAEVSFKATLSEPRDPTYNDKYGSADMEVLQSSEIRIWKKNSDNTKSIVYESNFYGTGTDVIIPNGPQSKMKAREISFVKPLSPGDYELECELLPDYLPAVSGGPNLKFTASFQKQLLTTGVGNIASQFSEYHGGGLRVNKMTWRDINNQIVKKDSFNYNDADGKSSGILTTPISYVQARIATSYSTTTSFANQWALYSSSSIPLSNSAKGNTVGYSYVERIQVGANNKNLGKMVYRFLNEADEYFGDLPTLPSYQNGLISAIEYYDSAGELRKKENFEYSKLYSKYYRGFKVDQVIGYTGGGLYINFYPILSERNVQIKHTATEVNNKMEIVDASTYQYNIDNGKVNKIETILSGGTKSITNYKYPKDFSSQGSVYSQMVANYIVNPVVYEDKIINNNKISKHTDYGSITNYSKLNFKPFSIEVFNNGISFEKTVFAKYDQYGNVLSFVSANGLITTCLWGYGGQYPIAEIKNATYAEVLTVLTQTEIDALNNPVHTEAVMETLIKNAATKLRNHANLSKSMISSYTYKPLVGMTSKTDARGVTEYYEYDGMQRLKAVLDQIKNVTTSMDYHYRPN